MKSPNAIVFLLKLITISLFLLNFKCLDYTCIAGDVHLKFFLNPLSQRVQVNT